MMLPGSAQFAVKPALPRGGELFFESQAVVFLEVGIDAALQWMKPQHVGGETVKGADLSFFQVAESFPSTGGDLIAAQPIACLKIAARDGPPVARPTRICIRLCKSNKPFPQSHFHFRCRFVGERQGDDLHDRNRSGLLHQQMHETIHEQGGLARPGSGYDHDIAIECRLSRLSRDTIRYVKFFIHRRSSAHEASSAFSAQPHDALSTTSEHVPAGTPHESHSRRNSRREE
jgi:hypothetical protein